MPDYVHYFKTDWGYAGLGEAEQRIARKYEALLRAEPDVTAEWIAARLGEASKELPGRAIRAVGEDDSSEWALIARDGAVEDDPAEEPFDADAADITMLLGADDYRAAGVERISTMLFLPEELLDQVSEKALELDTALSWVVQRCWQLAAGRLDEAARGKAYGMQRRRVSIYLTVAQWEEIKARAEREDRSMSSLVQRAVVVGLALGLGSVRS